jgi:PAS domain S-box-containing protein
MSTFDCFVFSLQGSGEGPELLAERTAEVLAEKRFLDSVIEHIPTPVYVKDAAQLRYVRINRAAEALFGMSREQMIGKSAHELFEKDVADVFVAQDRKVLAGGTVEDTPEHQFFFSNKEGLLLHIRKVPVFGEGGEPTHILGIVEDVTQQKKMEKEILGLNSALNARAENLEASHKSLEIFTCAATHDLRSPLSVIGGYAGLLEKNYASRLDEKGQRYLSVIRARVNGMAKLIDDLLAFSRLGLREVNKASVDMHGLARQVIEEMLQLHPEGKKPTIELGLLPPAQADAELLRQVWVNLLSNAVKYSSHAASPLIEVSGRMEGAEAVYSVRDNGAGFSMEHYDKLFEVFQRLHTDEEFEGTGVGLPIAHRVVTRHGGRMWAEGKVGHGAVFHFALPV